MDTFTKNIVLVFLGTTFANFLNLLYQLLVAHKLSASDFAAFNALLAIFTLIFSPFGTLQTALVKYIAEFNSRREKRKIQVLLSGFFKASLILAILILLIFYSLSFHIIAKLKIPSVPCAYILAILIAISCIGPIFAAGIQGLEFFGWLNAIAIIMGILKVILAFIFILWGFNVAGALGAFLISALIGIIISYLPLRQYFSLKAIKDGVNFKKILLYFVPVATSSFCFMGLVNFDMVLVRYFFSPSDSGLYSLAQMVGKIFLFLPAAISIVMFPRASALNAQNIDTISTLKRSLLYAGGLCVVVSLIYNLFPAFVLKVLTGKAYFESIILGRLFSISMTFFTLFNILMVYFLSIKDLRFIKYLILFTVLEFLGIALFHKSLIQVQGLLCVNAILLFFINLALAYRKEK